MKKEEEKARSEEIAVTSSNKIITIRRPQNLNKAILFFSDNKACNFIMLRNHRSQKENKLLSESQRLELMQHYTYKTIANSM